MSIQATQDLARKAQALFDLLSEPNRHIQSTLATDNKNRLVHPNSPNAICFCLIGGILRVEGVKYSPKENINKLYSVAMKTDLAQVIGKMLVEHPDVDLNSSDIYSFNDSKPHDDVMALLATVAAFTKGAADAGIEI